HLGGPGGGGGLGVLAVAGALEGDHRLAVGGDGEVVCVVLGDGDEDRRGGGGGHDDLVAPLVPEGRILVTGAGECDLAAGLPVRLGALDDRSRRRRGAAVANALEDRHRVAGGHGDHLPADGHLDRVRRVLLDGDEHLHGGGGRHRDVGSAVDGERRDVVAGV